MARLRTGSKSLYQRSSIRLYRITHPHLVAVVAFASPEGHGRVNFRKIIIFVTLGLIIGAAALFGVVRFIDGGTTQTGVASWYGPGFHGKKTASGERYDQNAMTAASRTLPLGTRARVINLENGKTVEVTINDRGPYVDDRIIDLSRAAARRLGFVKTGIVRVRIDVISDEIESE